jgi:hypothetical protein
MPISSYCCGELMIRRAGGCNDRDRRESRHAEEDGMRTVIFICLLGVIFYGPVIGNAILHEFERDD